MRSSIPGKGGGAVTLERLEPRLLLSADPATAARVIDNGDAAFATAGNWVLSTAGGYEGDRLSGAGSGGTATWTFSGLTPGYEYAISATWTAGADRGTAVSYRIIDHLGDGSERTLGSVSVNQSLGPDDFTASGAAWENLGDGYVFRGTSLSVELSGLSDGTVIADAIRIERVGSWVEPIGVPAPSFGIEESHWMYADPSYTYNYGSGAVPYRIGPNGPYTHYVDNTHLSATDSSNPFGTPDRPRRTIPETLSAGSVVEIHGGPYSYGTLSSGRYKNTLTSNGTAAWPVFIRGAQPDSKPVLLDMQLDLAGCYFILENLQLDGGTIRSETDQNHHVGIRHNEVRDFQPGGYGPTIGLRGRDIVIYDNRIHNNGEADAIEENDVMGVKVSEGELQATERVWVVDNHIHHNGGDSVLVEGNIGRPYELIPKYVYIGRNLMHEDRENAVDIKSSEHVIVSQNIIYGYKPTVGSGSDGTAIVAGHEESRLSWLLYNEIFQSHRGIRINDGEFHTVGYVVGNVFHDIEDVAIYTRRGSSLHVFNNVLYGVGAGFVDGSYGAQDSSDFHIFNNIIAWVSQGPHIEVSDHGTNAADSESHHNLLYQGGGQIRIGWGGVEYADLAAFTAGTGQGTGSLEADPKLVDPAHQDFRLAADSPAIDAGAGLRSYVGLYYSLYGVDIGLDGARAARIQGSAPDMGAFEMEGVRAGGPNAAPVVVGLSTYTDEEAPVGGAVSGSDADGDALMFFASAVGSHGFVSMNPDGSFVYAPAADWNGEAHFAFRAHDGWEFSPPGTVTVAVQPMQDTPTAVDDAVATLQNEPVSIEVLANDIEVDGDPLILAGFTQPAFGTASEVADGILRYTPAADWLGTDSFLYVVLDGQGGYDVGSVVVRVGNVAPVALDDDAWTLEETAVLIDVLGNDGDADGDALFVAYIGRTPNASVLINGDGTLTYTPDTDWYGTDSFTYRVSDGWELSAPATVSVTVAGVNDAPVAIEDRARTLAGDWVLIHVAANDIDLDGDELTVENYTQPLWGSVTQNTPAGLIYFPLPGWSGTDEFRYTVGDGHGGTDAAKVVVVVGNRPPIAGDDMVSTHEDAPVIFNVLANDTDPEEDPLTVLSYSVPAHGTVEHLEDGCLRYIPEANWHGSDAFSYAASDGMGGSSTGLVQVTVEAVNDLPVIGTDILWTEEGTPLIFSAQTLTGNDSDADGDALQLAGLSQPLHGAITSNGDGSFTYTPQVEWCGEDGFTYAVSDGCGGTAQAAVRVLVGLPNVAPQVSIAAPARGSILAAGLGITIRAETFDSDGYVMKVEFLVDGGKLGEADASPFDMVWTGASLGQHVLSAVATDNRAAVTHSSPITVTVALPGDADLNGLVDGADYTVWADHYRLAPPADANGDGQTDGADYTRWADHFGEPGSRQEGDFNSDGVVDGADYTVWADRYGYSGCGWVDGDFTGDGVVDGADYTIWADHFTGGSGGSAQGARAIRLDPPEELPNLLALAGQAVGAASEAARIASPSPEASCGRESGTDGRTTGWAPGSSGGRIAPVGDFQPLSALQGGLVSHDAGDEVPCRLPGVDGRQAVVRHSIGKLVHQIRVRAAVPAIDLHVGGAFPAIGLADLFRQRVAHLLRRQRRDAPLGEPVRTPRLVDEGPLRPEQAKALPAGVADPAILAHPGDRAVAQLEKRRLVGEGIAVDRVGAEPVVVGVGVAHGRNLGDSSLHHRQEAPD